MSISLTIPRLEMAMTAGTLVEWLVENGTEVREGDLIYILETGKTARDIEAPASGILKQTASPGEEYPVGTVIGEIV
jgi:pyruvate/2-oxoglutarate dehydrogenase complex dihydrolipoamide acyltransferase (E2) component